MNDGGEGPKKPGPGATRAASQAMGGAGALPDRPPSPGAVASTAAAARTAAHDLTLGAATGTPGLGAFRSASAAPVAHLTDEQARGRIARAGLRQMDRTYPVSGSIVTPLGPAQAYKVRERNTQGQGVDYIRTVDDHYPGSKVEPKTYPDMAKHMTAATAAAALGRPVDVSGESADARRAAATARALGDVSETQRNGAAKHARAALRTVAEGDLPPSEIYATKTPAFPQAGRPAGMQYHRDVMAAKFPMTPGQRTVVEHFSDSSDDEHGGPHLSDSDAIRRYRMRTETKPVRTSMVTEAASAATAAVAMPTSARLSGHRRERSPLGGTESSPPPPPDSVASPGRDSTVRRRVESGAANGASAKADGTGKKK